MGTASPWQPPEVGAIFLPISRTVCLTAPLVVPWIPAVMPRVPPPHVAPRPSLPQPSTCPGTFIQRGKPRPEGQVSLPTCSRWPQGPHCPRASSLSVPYLGFPWQQYSTTWPWIKQLDRFTESRCALPRGADVGPSSLNVEGGTTPLEQARSQTSGQTSDPSSSRAFQEKHENAGQKLRVDL